MPIEQFVLAGIYSGVLRTQILVYLGTLGVNLILHTMATLKMILVMVINNEQERFIKDVFSIHGWTFDNKVSHLSKRLQNKLLASREVAHRVNRRHVGAGDNCKNKDNTQNDTADKKSSTSSNDSATFGSRRKEELHRTKTKLEEPSCKQNKDVTRINTRSTATIDLSFEIKSKRKLTPKDEVIIYEVGSKNVIKEHELTNRLQLNETNEMSRSCGIMVADKTQLGKTLPNVNITKLSACTDKKPTSYTENEGYKDMEHVNSTADQEEVGNSEQTSAAHHIEHEPNESKHLTETYICSHCKKTFSSRTGLFNHTKGVHKQKYSYCCNKCDKTFLYKPHFVGHMNKHNRIKPFVCGICKKSFTYKQALNLHKKSCTGELSSKNKTVDCDDKRKMPKSKVLCDICGAALSSKSALKEHHTYLHSDRPRLVCQECGRLFKTYATLNRHMQLSHQEGKSRQYSCDTCGLKFKQTEVLRQHMKRHNKDFNAFCETCGKGFYSQFKLKEHQRIHTGEKPFTCSVCMNYKCSTKSNLLKHMKVHEKDSVVGIKNSRKKNKSKKSTIAHNQSAGHVNQLQHFTPKDDTMRLPEGMTIPMIAPPSGYLATDYTSTEGQGQSEGHYTNLPSMVLGGEMDRYGNNPYHSLSNTHINYEQYYGNPQSHVENTSQGLSILTAALNVVNPSQY